MPPANTACDLDPKESDIGVCDGDTAHKLHLPRSASANSALLVRSLIDSSPGPRNEPEEGTKLVQSHREMKQSKIVMIFETQLLIPK